MPSFDSAATRPDALIDFVCNICGHPNQCEPAKFDREVASCATCNSSVRTRAIIQMLSMELFGANLTIPDFPKLKSIRGFGMSDSADYAERLSEKFDYRNTFYHKAPELDIVNPPESELGAYDFIISSEVLEHVSRPVEHAFENLCRLLKPQGVLCMTVPYTLDERTAEHFPALHDWGLARLSDRMVLVNRKADGSLETYDSLVFHGGGGSTLEMRRFTELDLKRTIAGAGFSSVEIYSESYAGFGILRTENWSLPMAARKQPFVLTQGAVSELMLQWNSWIERAHSLHRELQALQADYDRHSAWAAHTTTEGERELKERTEWARSLERDLEERTTWALNLEQDVSLHVDLAQRLQAQLNERTEWAQRLDSELIDLRTRLNLLQCAKWSKLGRALGILR